MAQRDANSVILVGRLTRDMEVRHTNTGLAIGSFSLANNYLKKTGDTYGTDVSFFNCTMFGKQASSLAQYMLKGKQIVVEGEIRQDRWVQDGNNRQAVKIIVHNIQLLGGNRDKNNAQKDMFEETITGEFEADIPF